MLATIKLIGKKLVKSYIGTKKEIKMKIGVIKEI